MDSSRLFGQRVCLSVERFEKQLWYVGVGNIVAVCRIIELYEISYGSVGTSRKKLRTRVSAKGRGYRWDPGQGPSVVRSRYGR